MRSPFSSVKALVGMAAVASAAAIAATASATASAVADEPGTAVAILALTLALQLVTLRLPGIGSIGFSSLGLVLAAITLGAGPAMAIAVLAAVAQGLRRRGPLHRTVFDAANLALSAGAAAATYAAAASTPSTAVRDFAAAAAAGAVFTGVNHALLCLAMSVAESRPAHDVWKERFHWARYYLLAFAPLAGAMTVGRPERVWMVGSVLLALLLLARMRSIGPAHRAKPAA